MAMDVAFFCLSCFCLLFVFLFSLLCVLCSFCFFATSLRIQPSARRIHIHTSREKGALGMGSGMDSGSELRRSGKAQSLPRTGPTKTVWFLVLDLELEIGSVRCGDTIVLCLTWSRKQVLFDVATRLIGFLYLTWSRKQVLLAVAMRSFGFLCFT